MSFILFLRQVSQFADNLHNFARIRVIPSKEQIQMLLTSTESLIEVQKVIVLAMADSLASLHKKAVDAGVNPKTMPVGYLVMLQWTIDALEPIFPIIPQEKPEMRVVFTKLNKLKNDITMRLETLNLMGGEKAYKEIAFNAALLSRTTGITMKESYAAVFHSMITGIAADTADS